MPNCTDASLAHLRSIGRPGTRNLLALSCALVLSWALSAGALAQDPSESGGVLELEPWQEAQIVNNPWTAPRREGWNLGLEGVGNPHLREGTLLEDLVLPAPDTDASDARRSRALKTFASRTIDWSAPPAHLIDAAPEATPEPPAPVRRDGNLSWIVACLLGGALFLWWRRSR